LGYTTAIKMEKILENILTYFPSEKDKTFISKAAEFARKAHGSQKRDSGEPYICHPMDVALTLAGMGLDASTVIAGIFHDVVEDTPTTVEEIKIKWGFEVAFLVNGVTKLSKIQYSGKEAQAETLRKMFLAMAEDIRVVLIKLADRYHNMMTLDSLSPERQKKISLETLEIYAPVAYRLGMGELKGQLEDLSFKYLYPKEYQWLLREIKKFYRESEDYIKRFKPVLELALKKEGIKIAESQIRFKHYWTLYKKLQRHEMNFDKMHDLVAARVIVPTIEDCYLALGVVHQNWKPVPGLIKDYIALPKPNGYQSLHTSVFGPHGKIIEVQIRTPEMHLRAENGIAAHWAYKEGYFKTKSSKNLNNKETAWIDQLREWQKEVKGSDEFVDSLKIDFFKDRIFVLTPVGDVLDLPDGATPVDFAYQVHSDIGNQCSGAKINGKIVPLNTQLQSGDMVEILIQKNKKPSEDWLNFVKTRIAQDRIRSAIRSKIKNLAGPKIKVAQVAHLRVVVRDRIGILKDVSKVISSQKINILSVKTEGAKNPFHYLNFSVESKDKRRLEQLIFAIKKTKGVEEVSYQF